MKNGIAHIFQVFEAKGVLHPEPLWNDSVRFMQWSVSGAQLSEC